MIDDAPVRAPEFALTAVAGGSVSLAELVADGPALLVFVAEECPTSAMTLRRLAEPAKLLHRAGVSVAAVFEDPVEVAARTARRAGFAATVLSEPSPYPVSAAYELQSVPTTVLVDRAGRQVRRVVGWDRDGLGAALEEVGRLAGGPLPVSHRRAAAAQAGLRGQEHL